MRFRFNFTLGLLALGLSVAVLAPMGAQGDSNNFNNPNRGLTEQARLELFDDDDGANVDKYLGAFEPVSSEDVGDGWTKHTFDTDGGAGPICIAGTPYSVFTRAGNPAKLLIMLQGGGACWQDFYNCNIRAEDQEPPPPPVGIWDFESKDNPFRNYSVVYMPYCDGSVFGGDNDVVDSNPDWSETFGPVRHHRGLRNVSAGMDVAKATFPNASRITVAGSSAGGVGAAAFAPFLARFLYGNNGDLTVFNDAGPIAVNLLDVGAVEARATDWQFGQFYPASCTDCSDMGQQTAIIGWRLDNDRTIREAIYETDADLTNRFFTSTPTQFLYRFGILPEHGVLNAAHPDRYKRFIVSGSPDGLCGGLVALSHTALQGGNLNGICPIPNPEFDLFYEVEANGVLLNEWTDDFVRKRPFWVDIVEDYVELP